ncbi:MAG: HAD family phosphatase [Deltaproteobacteria bacterium]|nr:HAD family phosphatase [Deltaproteobacteria bacterium]
MVKAIVFDFGGVICRFDNDIFLRNLLPYTDKGFDELKERIYGSDLPRRYETGLVSSEEFFREVVRRCGLSITREKFIEAFTGIFTPIPSTFRLIERLKGRYKIGLLSNTNAWHYEFHFKNAGVLHHFDSVTLSFEIKEMKPGEKIYRDALGKLAVKPEECVYIDDIEAYAEAAKRIGIQGIHYVSHEALVADLKSLGVRA